MVPGKGRDSRIRGVPVSVGREGMVSVIIPVYNRAVLVKNAINSVLSQTYSNWELIISDNNSTDGTRVVLQNYAERDPRILPIFGAENVGPVKNWLRGIDAARGEYVKILWSDDWLADNFLEESVKVIRTDPRIAFVFSVVEVVGPSGSGVFYNPYESTTVFPGSEFAEGSVLSNRYPLSPGCALFRTDALRGNVIFDIPAGAGMDFNRFGAGSDLLMYLLPLVDTSRFVGYCADTRAYFLSHEGSISCSHDVSKYYEYAKILFLNKLGNRRLARKVLLKYFFGSQPGELYAGYAKRLGSFRLFLPPPLRNGFQALKRSVSRVENLGGAAFHRLRSSVCPSGAISRKRSAGSRD